MTACFDPADRLFQSFAFLEEKHLWPFADFLMKSFKSVSELQRLLKQRFLSF